jgi:hypothetical protein
VTGVKVVLLVVINFDQCITVNRVRLTNCRRVVIGKVKVGAVIGKEETIFIHSSLVNVA